jgi:hypothetical protein
MEFTDNLRSQLQSAKEQIEGLNKELAEVRKENEELQRRIDAIRIRNVFNAIKQICPTCGHTITEDGCAFCLRAQIATNKAAREFVSEFGGDIAQLLERVGLGNGYKAYDSLRALVHQEEKK